MNKEVIKKYGKGISIIISIIVILTTCVYWGYKEYYLPYQYKTLYNEGLSNLQIADSIADELSRLKQRNKAIELLTFAAEKGISKAQTKLALYANAYENNLEKSSYWYLQAAQNGDSEAQYYIGFNYLKGYGVKQNFDKAIYWINKSAKNKYSMALYEIGNFYLNGFALYDLDEVHLNYWYDGNNIFRGAMGDYCKVEGNDLDSILTNPKKVYIVPSLTLAKQYWMLAAKQGCSKAKEALEKIYEE